MNFSAGQLKLAWKPLLISAAILLLYAPVLLGLGRQWWNDDNYSHGLIIPFIIALIIWNGFDDLRDRVGKPELLTGITVMVLALFALFFGTLGGELFTQRLSLVFLSAGVVIYFFGHRLLTGLAVPFLLLLLAIPIPQIILNKVAFPLQLLATRVANAGLTTFGILTQRKGNVIELVTHNGVKAALEVVEACSGLR